MRGVSVHRSLLFGTLGGLLQLAAIMHGWAATWEEGGRQGFAGGEAQNVTVSGEHDGLILSFSGQNLLADPGFEGPPEKCPQTRNPYAPNSQPTDGWEHNGLAGQNGVVRAAPGGRTGQRAWELADTMKAGEPALLQRVVFRPEYRGWTFVFSIWARTRDGANHQAVIALKFNSKTHWRCDVMQRLAVGADWKQYVLTAAMPNDADELGVVIGPSSYEGQGAIIVDDACLALAAYAKGGTYVSAPHDMGAEDSRLWQVKYRASTPEQTRIALMVRTGKTASPDASWSAWEKADKNPYISLSVPPGRYLQYKVQLMSESSERTPVLQNAEFSYGARLGFVTGRVTHGRTGAPISGAMVALGDETSLTDKNGEFLLGVQAGEVRGRVKASHYLPEAVGPRMIREGDRVRADFKLWPDPRWWTFRGNAQRQGYSALVGSLEGLGVAWQYPLGTVGGGQILPADVDGDGRKEFVIARGGSLSARRLNGDLLWQVDGWEIGSILGVYDLLGNGEKQVIGLSAGWQPYANGAFTVVSGRDGKVLSRVDEWPDAGDIGHGDTKDYLHGSFSPLSASSCVVADLDQDGKLEIMVHPNYHSALMTFDFHDGLTRPKMMWKTRNKFKYDLYLYPLLSADVDGDGRLEIVFHDNDLIRIFDGRTGEEKSAADMGCPQGLFGTMACGDVDGDGRAEVVLIPSFKPQYKRNTIALAGWDGKALVRRWTRDSAEPVTARHFAPPLTSPLADVDGDRAMIGRESLEVTVQVGPDVLVLSGVNGDEKYRIAQATLTEVADLDGDGVAEIIVRKGSQALVYNGKGGFGPKDITYPASWGWKDLGDGDLCQLRGGAAGQTEVVNQKGKVKAVLPGAAYMTTPIVADLDGNGQMRVLVRGADAVIRVLDAASGSPRRLTFPELKCDLPGEVTRGGGITVCDLEEDGKSELVFRQEGHLVVANSDGTVRFRSEAGGLNFPAIGRFDRDGVLDIACYAGQRWIAYSGKSGKVIWDGPAPESNEVATGDVDGDGRDEITGKHGPVFLLSGADGRVLWTAFRKEQCALGLGTFADLDGDGRMEVLITGEYSNTAWFSNGKPMWWPGWSSGGAKEHYGAVADVNGDGAWDLGLSSNHGVLYCLDGRDGRELWAFKIPRKVSLSHCAAADLDSDGKPEFVFGTNTGDLIIVNGEDGSLAKSVHLGYPVGEPIVADVNGDGEAEVLVVSNGTLYCLASLRSESVRPAPTSGGRP